MDTTEDSLILQKKLYFLLEQLQNMAKDLPPKYQMRLPCELLSSLANCLLNETVFEIVKGLLEIQHVTEQHLYQQRLQFVHQKKSTYRHKSRQQPIRWYTQEVYSSTIRHQEVTIEPDKYQKPYISIICKLLVLARI
ncbi:protein DGCR6L [Diabrotica virgifera virgifera]|uniref:Gonadal protein gdl n=1 Tax=Diabrotica virgifera virgifera TaxID=50390 RepID=A0ABM5KPK6_DIAVI|nr:protein DGCR6L [Diabrotica virgifera virgifera]